jgi:SAM-dependent methyltransferase
VAGANERATAAEADVTVPSIARTYDYFLGGTDNFEADRELAGKILRFAPETRDAARANRRFLGRTVDFLARAGIRQFLDLGAGLPSQNNVHEVARLVRPDARVVYVDNDPVVLNHAEALLAEDECTAVICEDVREPERILAHPTVRGMLDFSQPVAVMCLAVLHFVTDEQDPWRVVSALTGPLVPGSYLALSHSSLDDTPPEISAAIQERYKTAAAPAVWRGREAITRFFTGLDLVDPGLVTFTDWRADDLERGRPGGDCTWVLAGVARKP